MTSHPDGQSMYVVPDLMPQATEGPQKNKKLTLQKVNDSTAHTKIVEWGLEATNPKLIRLLS